MSIVAPRRMTNDDVSSTPELSGGDLSWSPPEFRWCWSRRPWAGDMPGRECPGEDHEMRPLAGTSKPSSGTVSDDNSMSPCGGGGGCPPSVVAGCRWCWSMGPWLGTLHDGSVHVKIGIGDRGLA